MSKRKFGCLIAFAIIITVLLFCYFTVMAADEPVVINTEQVSVLTPVPVSPPEISLPEPSPDLSLDSDNDGFSDWFETNISQTDPLTPNDRYAIIYLGPRHEASLTEAYLKFVEFFVDNGVSPKNIITLFKEEFKASNSVDLHKAIEEIAAKADENDFVFISLHAHSSTDHFGGTPYGILDEWLDKIKAKTVIIQLLACNSETGLPVIKDGPCPRIVFIHYGELMSALGCGPVGLKYNIEVDTLYGNGDGYVNLAEIHNWYENDWKHQPRPPAVKPEKGNPTMLDSSNIASKIYLTDYTPPNS